MLLADVFYFPVSLYNIKLAVSILIDDHFSLRHNILSINTSASLGKELKIVLFPVLSFTKLHTVNSLVLLDENSNSKFYLSENLYISFPDG